MHRTVKDFYDYGEFDPDMKTDDSYNNDLGDDEQYDDTDNENDENDDE